MSATRLISFALVVASLMVSHPLAPGEERPGQPRPIGGLSFVDEVEVTVVNVATFVTDRQGRAVTALTQGDFRILQDGQGRPISNFALYTADLYRRADRPAPAAPDAPPSPAPAGETATAELRPIHVVVYVDNENLRPPDRNRVLRQMSGFVRTNLHPPVEMMVVQAAKSAKVIQDFTSDSEAVLDALRSLLMTTGGRQERDSTRRDILHRMQRYSEDPNAGSTNAYRSVAAEINAFAEEEANSLTFTLEALRGIVSAVAGLPGKKIVLYISDGLPMLAGADLFSAAASAYNDPSLLTLSARHDQSRKLASVVATANAQDVTFYPVSASGLQVTGMATAEHAGPQDSLSATMGESNYLDSLRYLADSTGGLAIFRTNDYAAGLERVAQDMFTFYSLGYTVAMTGGDRVHRVEVKVPAHPEYTVRCRERFVEKSLETRIQDKVLSSLLFPITDNPLEATLEVGTATPAGADRWTLPVHLSFPLPNVALLPAGEELVGRVVLFVAIRDSSGKQSDLVRQEHEVRVTAASYAEDQDKRHAVDTSLLVETGSYRIAVGLMDQVTRQAAFLGANAVVAR